MEDFLNTEYLCCAAGEARIGIDVNAVQEVFETRLVTRLPGCPAFVLGMVNMRGSVIPVLNPWALDAAPAAIKKIAVLKTAEGLVGILISRLMDLVRLTSPEPPQPLPGPLNRGGDYFDVKAMDPDSGACFTLNVERLIQETLNSATRKV